MADLRERFRELDALRPPDLRPRIRDLGPVRPPKDSPWRRLAAAAVALLLAAGGLTVVVRAFVRPAERDSQEPAPGSVVVDPRVTATVSVGTFPSGIAAANGEVWVSVQGNERCLGEVVRVDQQTNQVTARIRFPGFPNDLAIGPDSLWMEGTLCSDDVKDPLRVVTRIDPVRGKIVATIPLGQGYPSDIAAAASDVWVTTNSEEDPWVGEVLRIDPRSNEVDLRVPIEGDPRDVVTDDSGVWVLNRVPPSESTGGLELIHIDPQTGRIEATVPGAGGVGLGEGFVWMPRRLGGGRSGLERINPTTDQPVGEPIIGSFIGFAGGHGTLGTLPVGEGGVWFVSYPPHASEARVYRLNASTLEVDASVDLPQQSWLDAALDPDTHTLWISHVRDSVTRIDLRPEPAEGKEPPVDPQVTAKIDVGAFPLSIAVDQGAVWVSIPAQEASEDDTLVRIDPETDRVVSRITTAEPLENLLAGQGGVWGTATEGSGPPYRLSLIKLDPVAETVVARVPDVAGMAIGHGSIWGVRLGAEELVRVDAVTAEKIVTIPLPEAISHLVVGEGAVWAVTLEGQATDVLKIDPQTNEIVASLDVPTAGTIHHPAAGAGYLWLPMVSTDFQASVLRVDPMSVEIVGSPIPIKATGAFATDGAGLWLLGEKGAVERLNAGTLEIDARAKFEWPAATFQPTAVLDPTAGTIWVANYRDTVTRIDLR